MCGRVLLFSRLEPSTAVMECSTVDLMHVLSHAASVLHVIHCASVAGQSASVLIGCVVPIVVVVLDVIIVLVAYVALGVD
eukprot:5186803-Amphidinium_carterae.1